MNDTTGKVYDIAEMDRIKGWLDRQENQFITDEKVVQKKEVLIQAAVLITASIVIIFAVKKLVK